MITIDTIVHNRNNVLAILLSLSSKIPSRIFLLYCFFIMLFCPIVPILV